MPNGGNRLPTITSQIPRDLRLFLDRVREFANDLDTSNLITRRSLQDLGLTDVAGNLISADNQLGIPPAPTNFTADGAFRTVILGWDSPAYPGHAYAEVWASATYNILLAPEHVDYVDPLTLDDISQATRIGMAPGGVYVDEIGSGNGRYYWANFVNTEGTAGPLNAVGGTLTNTAPDIDYLIGILEGQISESELSAALNTRIDTSEQEIGNLLTTYGSTSSAAASAAEAAQDAIDAAAAASTATSQAGLASTSAGQASTSETNAAGSASAASTSETTTAASRDAAGVSAGSASASAVTAASSATTATGQANIAITQAGVATSSANTATGAAAAAGISETNSATSATDSAGSASAAASSVTNISAIVDDAASAAVQTEAIARADADGELQAQYTVKVDLNGYVAGYGLASTLNNGVPTSSMVFRVDTFSIGSPGSPTISPFIVTAATTLNGVAVPAGVYIQEAYIRNGAIVNAKIGNAAIDDAKIANLSAGKITAGFLSADRISTGSLDAKIATIQSAQIASLDATKITTGFIDAARINVGSIDARIAAIESAQISSLGASKIAAGTINVSSGISITGTNATGLDISSAATGARTRYTSGGMKVYDASGVLRVNIGNLA